MISVMLCVGGRGGDADSEVPLRDRGSADAM